MVECPGFACVAWKVVDARDETFPAMLAADIVRYHGGEDRATLRCFLVCYCADAPPTLAADAAPRHRPEGGGVARFACRLGSQPLRWPP